MRWSHHQRLNRIVLRNCLKLSEPHADLWARQAASSRPSDRRSKTPDTAIGLCVETTARYNELVTVCRMQTKPRSDVGGRGEMVAEVPRCLTMKTAYIMTQNRLIKSLRKKNSRRSLYVIAIYTGLELLGVEPLQFMSADAHFWVKIGLKLQSLGKIVDISAADPPPSSFRSIPTTLNK